MDSYALGGLTGTSSGPLVPIVDRIEYRCLSSGHADAREASRWTQFMVVAGLEQKRKPPGHASRMGTSYLTRRGLCCPSVPYIRHSRQRSNGCMSYAVNSQCPDHRDVCVRRCRSSEGLLLLSKETMYCKVTCLVSASVECGQLEVFSRCRSEGVSKVSSLCIVRPGGFLARISR